MTEQDPTTGSRTPRTPQERPDSGPAYDGAPIPQAPQTQASPTRPQPPVVPGTGQAPSVPAGNAAPHVRTARPSAPGQQIPAPNRQAPAPGQQRSSIPAFLQTPPTTTGTRADRTSADPTGDPESGFAQGNPVPSPEGRPSAHKAAGTRFSARTSSGSPNDAGGSPTGPSAYARRRVGVPVWFLALVIVAVVALLTAVIALSVRACSTPSEPVEPATTQTWVSPYDWDDLTRLDNGFLAYYADDGSLASEAGVDVSEHDGSVDWAAVKAAGADFAMIRLGYRGYSQGTIALDDYFLANIQGASAAGLKVGVYFFSQAISEEEAREEAQYVINTLSGLGITLAYPVAFDQEPITNGDIARTDNLTDAQLTANALAFCQAIEQAGYQAMIYGNQHDLARLDLTGELSAYPLWYAEYEAAGNVPTGEFDFVMWQYTASGTVDGMSTSAGQVDMNIRFLANATE